MSKFKKDIEFTIQKLYVTPSGWAIAVHALLIIMQPVLGEMFFTPISSERWKEKNCLTLNNRVILHSYLFPNKHL